MVSLSALGVMMLIILACIPQILTVPLFLQIFLLLTSIHNDFKTQSSFSWWLLARWRSLFRKPRWVSQNLLWLWQMNRSFHHEVLIFLMLLVLGHRCRQLWRLLTTWLLNHASRVVVSLIGVVCGCITFIVVAIRQHNFDIAVVYTIVICQSHQELKTFLIFKLFFQHVWNILSIELHKQIMLILCRLLLSNRLWSYKIFGLLESNFILGLILFYHIFDLLR